MTLFDQEMEIFKEIISQYKPLKGYHLVLNLADYKQGKETLCKYKIGCDKYHHYINVECHDKNIEIVMITSNIHNSITYRSKYLYATFCYELNEFVQIEDLAPSKQVIKRSVQQELELLCYELHNPQTIKPDC